MNLLYLGPQKRDKGEMLNYQKLTLDMSEAVLGSNQFLVTFLS